MVRALNLFHICLDFFNIAIRRRVPVYYFYKEKNVGDLLTPYLVEKITGKPVHNVKSRKFGHLLGVGSMIHRAKRNSDIWGTGTLDYTIGSQFDVSELKVHALRGHLTAEILYRGKGYLDQCVLGDPAILMPDFYKPAVEKQYKVGVIPHYVDFGSSSIVKMSDVHVINVRKDPEEFVRELLMCDYILSSSLHGLILADAYGIKNKWVSFSNKVTGGGFKFRDYYSTTEAKGESCLTIDSRDDFKNAVNKIEDYASVKSFSESKDRLISSFPDRYFGFVK